MKMKKTVPAVLLLLAAAGWAPALPGQSLWKKARRKISPIEDIIARNIGDILTIVVKEDHKTKAQDKTDRKQENTLYAKLQAYTITPKTFQTPLPEVNLKGTQTFKGDNKQERDQEVEARIAGVFVINFGSSPTLKGPASNELPFLILSVNTSSKSFIFLLPMKYINPINKIQMKV